MIEPIPERALRAVGDLLKYEGEKVDIVILGGSALILLGLVHRVTTDVDILALVDKTADKAHLVRPDSLPDVLLRAISRVAEDLGLRPDWMNTVPAGQWDTGLPPGLGDRLEWRDFGALRVGLVSRYDLIFFKLYAAADHVGPASVHYQDLLALRPSLEELRHAVAWIATQDTSPDFAGIVEEVARRARADVETSN